MEGTMWKWTNYWTAWQPRWFILDNGVLAYYKSQEEVNQGCKGSIKMSACEIQVHPTDNTRLDLVIPSEQHFYLKAATAQERQQWLVALGSAKACLNAGKKKSGVVENNPDALKSKKSELRLYCDLLMQQVHSVKTAATQPGQPDIEKMDEATSLLSATCDTFIKTLEDCIRLANANFMYELPHQHITDSALPTSQSTTTNSLRKNGKPAAIHSNSIDRSSMQFSLTDDSSYCIQASSDIAAAVHTVNKVASTTCSSSSSSSRSWERLSSSCLEDTDNLPMCETPDSSLLVSVSNNNNSDQAPNKNPCCEDSSDILSPMTTAMSLSASDTSQKSASKDAGSTLPVQTVETFFSRQKYRFSDIELAENLDIPTTRFLDACRGLTSIFDLLGSTTFAPVKMDMNGNIGKLQKKYDSDPVKFALLQSMMRQEMQDKTTRARNSATDALLWLKRGVEFTYEFFVLFLRGDPDLTNCATAAYSKTLRKYHGWVARGLLAVCLSVASRAIPYRSDFVRLLALNPPAEIDVSQFDQQVHSECVEYITGVSKILKVINQFYQENNLDSTEIV